jgi:hypothetical protein
MRMLCSTDWDRNMVMNSKLKKAIVALLKVPTKESYKHAE